jgi:hypothetical protein
VVHAATSVRTVGGKFYFAGFCDDDVAGGSLVAPKAKDVESSQKRDPSLEFIISNSR